MITSPFRANATAAGIEADAQMLAHADAEAERIAAVTEPRMACKPTTTADLIRLAEKASAAGVAILRAVGDSGYFALSGTVAGLIYPVDPVGGCACKGYQRAGRCQHHSYLLAVLGMIHPDPAPEPIAPAVAPQPAPGVDAIAAPFIAELIAMRPEWERIAKAITYAAGEWRNHGDLQRLIDEKDQMMVDFRVIAAQAEQAGVNIEVLRDAWREAPPFPAPVPGIVAIGDEMITIEALENTLKAASDRSEKLHQMYMHHAGILEGRLQNGFSNYRVNQSYAAVQAYKKEWQQAEHDYESALRRYTVACNGDDYAAATAA